MKKLFTFFALLAAVTLTSHAAAYDLWVCGVQVTDENKDDIVGAIEAAKAAAGDESQVFVIQGKAWYDPEANILTLNNFATMYGDTCIINKTFDKFTIRCIGGNSMLAQTGIVHRGSRDMLITGDDLIILAGNVSEEPQFYGIHIAKTNALHVNDMRTLFVSAQIGIFGSSNTITNCFVSVSNSRMTIRGSLYGMSNINGARFNYSWCSITGTSSAMYGVGGIPYGDNISKDPSNLSRNTSDGRVCSGSSSDILTDIIIEPERKDLFAIGQLHLNTTYIDDNGKILDDDKAKAFIESGDVLFDPMKNTIVLDNVVMRKKGGATYNQFVREPAFQLMDCQDGSVVFEVRGENVIDWDNVPAITLENATLLFTGGGTLTINSTAARALSLYNCRLEVVNGTKLIVNGTTYAVSGRVYTEGESTYGGLLLGFGESSENIELDFRGGIAAMDGLMAISHENSPQNLVLINPVDGVYSSEDMTIVEQDGTPAKHVRYGDESLLPVLQTAGEAAQAAKMLRNGQVRIVRGERVYNVLGIRL